MFKRLCSKVKVSETDFGLVPVLLNKWDFLMHIQHSWNSLSLLLLQVPLHTRGTVRGGGAVLFPGRRNAVYCWFSLHLYETQGLCQEGWRVTLSPATSAVLGCWLLTQGWYVLHIFFTQYNAFWQKKTNPNRLYSMRKVSSAAFDFQALDEREEKGYTS